MKNLTEPQARLLSRVREAGTLTQNGRARRTVEALAARGLITYEFDLIPHWNGRYTKRYIITATTEDR